MKKLLSIIITLSLLFTLLPSATFSADSTKIDLTKAIDIAKKTFNFNTKNMDFNNGYTENPDGTKIWNLNWYSKNGTGGSFSVSIDADTGEVISMNQWENNPVAPSRIPKHTKDEAIKVAKEIALKLQPEKFKQTILSETQSMPYYDMYSDTYNIYFKRQVNGIDYQNNGITVNVDKNTLKVRNFYITWDKGTFPDKTKAMSLDAAKKIFAEQLGLELTYNIIYNNNNEPKVILAYALKNGNRPIDAITGELVKNTYYPMGGYAADKAMLTSAAGGSGLTPQEQKVVDNASKYITKEAALEIVKKYITIDSKYTLSNSNLYGGYGSENASWNFNWNFNNNEKNEYGYISATVDAVTSELKNYYFSDSEIDKPKDTDPKYTKDQAREIAVNYLQQMQSEKFKQSEYRDTFNEYEATIPRPLNYTYNFVRMVNGIACPNNNLYVTVNAYTGQITNYSVNWSNIQFPAATGVISLADAYKALYAKADFSLKYFKYVNYMKYNDPGETKLVYILDKFNGLMDAKTGAFIDYSGNPIIEQQTSPFTDIKGDKAENDIKLLVELGVIEAKGTKFKPADNILQKDFIKMVVRSLQPYYGPVYASGKEGDNSEYDYYYDQAIQRKIISPKAKNMNAVVTRQDAAKMLVRALGAGFIVDIPGIFKVSFKDTSKISSSLRSYAFIANKLGIMDAPGNVFNPKKQLTRGETATILVKYMKVDTTPQE